jgi:phosphoadenosine phosphosulfate reductase
VLYIFGHMSYSEPLGAILLKSKPFNYTLFQDGTFKLNTNQKESAEADAKRVSDIVLRANACVGCGLCLPKCKHNSLYLKENKIMVGDCKHCLACLDVKCPVLKFGRN